MRSHARAPFAGFTEGSGEGRGLLRRACAVRGASSDGKGTGAPSTARAGAAIAVGAALLLAAFVPPAMAAVEATPSYGPTGSFANDQLYKPTQVAVEPGTGNIFIANSGNGQVQVYTPSADTANSLTSFGENELASPFGIAIDQGTGGIYVTSAPVRETQFVRFENAASGTFTLTFEGETTEPIAFKGADSGDEEVRAEIQAKLEELSAIGAGNVEVLQVGSAYRIVLGAVNVEEMIADGTQLVKKDDAGPSAAVTVGTQKEGAPSRIVKFKADNSTNPPTYSEDPSFVSPAEGASAGEVGSFSSPIAVDPVSHDLLVADTGNKRVERFTSAGAAVPGFNGAVSASGSLAGPLGIAVGLTGTVYVVDAEGDIAAGAQSRVLRFTSTGAPSGELAGAISPAAVAVDPGTGRITVGGDSLFEVNPRSLYVFEGDGTPVFTAKLPFESSPTGFAGKIAGLAIADSSRLYVLTDYNYDCCGTVRVQTLVPYPIPGAEFGAVSDVTPTTVHVTAKVAAGGVDTTVRFEISLNGTDWTVDPDQTVISGSGEETVEADLTVAPSNQYSIRVRAANAYLSTISANTGTVTSASTLPGVTNVTATNITTTGAVLNGTVSPHGPQTTYRFEYGETTAYGKQFPANSDDAAGSGGGSHPATGWIVSLSPGTLYHYRLVAMNSLGTTYGEDHTFTTDPATSDFCPNAEIREIERATELPECRAYEQVSPVEKGGVGIDNQDFDPTFTRDDGGGIAYSTEKGVFPGAESNPIIPKVLSTRSETDWTTKTVDPPIEAVVPAENHFIATVTFSKDLTRALVSSTLRLTPDAPSNGGLYIRNTETGEYTLIGPGLDLSGPAAAAAFIGASDDLRTIALEKGVLIREGSPPQTAVPGGNAGYKRSHNVHQVSTDGRRAYFDVVVPAPGGPAPGMYLIEEGQSAPIPISVSHVPGAPSDPVPASFEAASPDGRFVVFKTGGQGQVIAGLTPDAPTAEGNTYRYDVETDTLTYLVRIYDVALARPAQNVLVYRGSKASPTNLYYLHNGASRILGSISGDGYAPAFAQASPNGKYVVFGDKLYDAEADTITCIACRTDGGRYLGEARYGQGEHTDIIGRKDPMPVLDDGTVFFDTPNPLDPRDSNGTRDLYSYDHGKISLLTNGRRPGDVAFLDATPDGEDVFFSTIAPLVGQDRDKVRDLYDVRVEGGLFSQNPPPLLECLRDDCKATPNTGPELPFGGSEGLTGPENFKPKSKARCRKGQRVVRTRGKTRCVKHKARAKNNRRQGR